MSNVCLSIKPVLRYAVAAIYTNFSTSVSNDENFGRDGKFVTGGSGDNLFLKFEHLERDLLDQKEPCS